MMIIIIIGIDGISSIILRYPHPGAIDLGDRHLTLHPFIDTAPLLQNGQVKTPQGSSIGWGDRVYEVDRGY